MDNNEKLKILVGEAVTHSNFYKALDDNKKKLFTEIAVRYSQRVLNNASRLDISQYWKVAADLSGADRLLKRIKTHFGSTFDLKRGGAFDSAIKTTARDALHLIVNPKAHGSLDGLTKNKESAKTLKVSIQRGRTFATHENQPPSTGSQTLRRRK